MKEGATLQSWGNLSKIGFGSRAATALHLVHVNVRRKRLVRMVISIRIVLSRVSMVNDGVASWRVLSS